MISVNSKGNYKFNVNSEKKYVSEKDKLCNNDMLHSFLFFLKINFLLYSPTIFRYEIIL